MLSGHKRPRMAVYDIEYISKRCDSEGFEHEAKPGVFPLALRYAIVCGQAEILGDVYARNQIAFSDIL